MWLEAADAVTKVQDGRAATLGFLANKIQPFASPITRQDVEPDDMKF